MDLIWLTTVILIMSAIRSYFTELEDSLSGHCLVAPEKNQWEVTAPVQVTKGTFQIVSIGDALQVQFGDDIAGYQAYFLSDGTWSNLANIGAYG